MGQSAHGLIADHVLVFAKEMARELFSSPHRALILEFRLVCGLPVSYWLINSWRKQMKCPVVVAGDLSALRAASMRIRELHGEPPIPFPWSGDRRVASHRAPAF
jgi:hypothetical protein